MKWSDSLPSAPGLYHVARVAPHPSKPGRPYPAFRSVAMWTGLLWEHPWMSQMPDLHWTTPIALPPFLDTLPPAPTPTTEDS